MVYGSMCILGKCPIGVMILNYEDDVLLLIMSDNCWIDVLLVEWCLSYRIRFRELD
jgi:hypothetical protein